ncbi:MAG: TIGR00268 family protein, partial [Candidatus Latescibacterota bacterium]
ANVDDSYDYRPGSQAAGERNVVAPLVDAGFSKDMIRRAASALGLVLWDKPSSPCLASRIPYNTPVTAEKLAQIEQAGNALKDMGFPICRVRHHGDIARIEVPKEDRARLFAEGTWGELSEQIKRAGFQYVTVDLEGFRSGSLNEPLGGAQ